MKNTILCLLLTSAVVVVGLSPTPTVSQTPQEAGGLPVSTEARQEPAVTLEPVPEADPLPDYLPKVHAVRARGWDSQRRAIYAEATAVDVGATLFTVAHLLEGITSTPVVEVQREGTWQRVSWVKTAPDLLALTIAGVSAAESQPIRSATFGEPVRLFGLKSEVWQCGRVTNTNPLTVSLETSEPGIEQGDSGGPVVSETGDVLGVIRGKNPDESRVVYVQQIPSTAVTPSAAPGTVFPVPPSPAMSNNDVQCINGVCTRPQQQMYSRQPRRWRLFR